MFGLLFELIIFIVIIRAFRDSRKNRQRRQQGSQGSTPPPVLNRPTATPYKPPVPNKPASKKQKPGWTPKPEKTKTAVPNRPNPGQGSLLCGSSLPVLLSSLRSVTARRTMRENATKNGCRFLKGKRVCRCGYCAADNLIPKGADPGNYTCYFCREEL